MQKPPTGLCRRRVCVDVLRFPMDLVSSFLIIVACFLILDSSLCLFLALCFLLIAPCFLLLVYYFLLRAGVSVSWRQGPARKGKNENFRRNFAFSFSRPWVSSEKVPRALVKFEAQSETVTHFHTLGAQTPEEFVNFCSNYATLTIA
jgi:hypothetical protein